MARQLRSALLLLALLGLAGSVSALEIIPWFADNPTLEFVAGTPVQATLGVINSDATPVNLTVIGGQLATAYDANLNVLNLTTNFLNNIPLPPGAEVSLDYTFGFPAALPPHEFFLKLFLVSSTAEGFQQTVAFNQTINVIEQTSFIDFQLIGLWIIFLGFFAGIGYLGYEWALAKGLIKKTKKKKAAVATGPIDKSDYLKGTPGHAFLQRRAARQAA